MVAIHLLCYDLDADTRGEAELGAILHLSEVVRANRFVFPHLQRRYRVGRAVLRAALAHFTGIAPASFELEFGPQGKPMLPGGPSFNVSHSEGRLLLAITSKGRIGVDIEIRREVGDLEALARANFAPDEAAMVLAAPKSERDQAFLETWTRKEALVKALGGGLSIPLNSFSVAGGQSDGNLLRRLDIPGEDLLAWSLYAIPGIPSAVASVALDAPDLAFEWLPPEVICP